MHLDYLLHNKPCIEFLIFVILFIRNSTLALLSLSKWIYFTFSIILQPKKHIKTTLVYSSCLTYFKVRVISLGFKKIVCHILKFVVLMVVAKPWKLTKDSSVILRSSDTILHVVCRSDIILYYKNNICD